MTHTDPVVLQAQSDWRIPVSDTYASVFGRAVYHFAYLENCIINIGQIINPPFWPAAGKVDRRTSGQLFKAYKQAVDIWNGPKETKERLEDLAKSLTVLVEQRNRLVHGRPITASNGEQVLYHYTSEAKVTWNYALVEQAAWDFQAAAIEAGTILDQLR